jgi:hypothetical protein
MVEERVIGIIGMKIMPNFSKLGKRVQLQPAIHALILLNTAYSSIEKVQDNCN